MSSSNNKESHNDLKISPEAVVSVDTNVKGSISVGSKTIIYPKASVIAEAGPVIIGENNTIEEQASIIHSSNDEAGKEHCVTIGVYNVFKAGCEIHARSIGDHNIFESKCYVGPNVEIGNGCIIGAGCRIAVTAKLPDLTAVMGQECVRRVSLNEAPGSEDLTQQSEEINAMSAIFTKEEFKTYSACDEVHAVFNAHIPLSCDLELSLLQEFGRTRTVLKYLPPIQLIVSLPRDYPSGNCPGVTLSCCWLNKSHLKLLLAELKKLWDENKSEILFIWCSFLKYESLDVLQITNSYELNVPLSLIDLKTKDQTKILNTKMWNVHTSKAVKNLFFYMVEVDDFKKKEHFKKSMHDCNICFCQVKGEQCMQMDCGHIACVECLRRMCQVHIQQGTVESIVCCQENCGLELHANLVNELVSKEMYERFDKLMLNRALDDISKCTYCPRPICQYPTSTQEEESLAVCPSCGFAFCKYCRRVYHGIEGCKRDSEENKKIIETYRNADPEKRLELEKRYGKKFLVELVNKAETETWISRNSKQCPCCKINIEKNDGCNKMICKKCNANFCWLCLERVSSSNPYLHYKDPKSKCFNLLFDGVNDHNHIPEED